jgi:hypothetical protein
MARFVQLTVMISFILIALSGTGLTDEKDQAKQEQKAQRGPLEGTWERAYKYPRELNWIVGVLLLALGMFEGFTGYLLPWDQTSYWATVVGININATAPFLGPFIAQFFQGGAAIGADTLSKFYSLHMLVLPGAIAGLIALHLYLVIRLGVTPAPWSDDAEREREGAKPRAAAPAEGRAGLTRPGRRGGADGV